MARMTIRNLPESIHQQLTAAAEQHQRSTEAEIRFALQQYVAELQLLRPTTGPESTRQRWQRQTGQRIAQLFVRLRQDEVFAGRGRHDVPHLARMIGEASPATLLDVIDGLEAPSFDLLRRISCCFHCSESWLLSGAGPLFLWENLAEDYAPFFSEEAENSRRRLRLIRLCGGQLDGTLLCIRYDNQQQHFTSGYLPAAFPLRSTFSAEAAEQLCRLISLLKTLRGARQIEAYDMQVSETLSGVNDHHPRYFMRQSVSTPANWLQKLFAGEDPADWFSVFPSALATLREVPFAEGGNDEFSNASWTAID